MKGHQITALLKRGSHIIIVNTHNKTYTGNVIQFRINAYPERDHAEGFYSLTYYQAKAHLSAAQQTIGKRWAKLQALTRITRDHSAPFAKRVEANTSCKRLSESDAELRALLANGTYMEIHPDGAVHNIHSKPVTQNA